MITTSIVDIGNSQGVRLPRLALIESGLKQQVELYVKKGEIRIVSAPVKRTSTDTLLLSEKALASDWDRVEEDEAWASLR